MTDGPMIEKIAAEIAKGVESGQLPTEMARRVLEVMRTPTNGMLNAAAKALSPAKRPTPTRVSNRAKHLIRYRAMIDVALASATWEEVVAPEVTLSSNPPSNPSPPPAG